MLKLATENQSIVLLVDGLDECSDAVSDLRAILQGLCGFPHVRLLASSRPEKPFEDYFDGSSNIRLQDLTYNDIQKYEQGRIPDDLSHATYIENHDLRCIRNEITYSAEGVFLWVKISTHTVLDELVYQEKPDDIIERLHDLPTNLDEMYRTVISRLDKRGSKRALLYCGLLTAIQRISSFDKTPTLLALAAVDLSISGAATSDPSLLLQRVQDVHKFITARCTNIITMVDQSIDAGSAVGFIHRPAADYFSGLVTVSSQDASARCTPSEGFFEPSKAHLLLLRLAHEGHRLESIMTLPSNTILLCDEYCKPMLSYDKSRMIRVPRVLLLLRHVDCGDNVHSLLKELQKTITGGDLSGRGGEYDNLSIEEYWGAVVFAGLGQYVINDVRRELAKVVSYLALCLLHGEPFLGHSRHRAPCTLQCSLQARADVLVQLLRYQSGALELTWPAKPRDDCHDESMEERMWYDYLSRFVRYQVSGYDMDQPRPMDLARTSAVAEATSILAVFIANGTGIGAADVGAAGIGDVDVFVSLGRVCKDSSGTLTSLEVICSLTYYACLFAARWGHWVEFARLCYSTSTDLRASCLSTETEFFTYGGSQLNTITPSIPHLRSLLDPYLMSLINLLKTSSCPWQPGEGVVLKYRHWPEVCRQLAKEARAAQSHVESGALLSRIKETKARSKILM